MSIYKYLPFLIILPACNLINPKEQVPTYLHLERFTFNNPDSSYTGSSSHDIPSAWVYVNDQPVGTFDLPCTVPVLSYKTGKVTIIPAVTNQGIKSYVSQYPFYQSDSTVLVYNPGKIQNYSPKTSYSKDLTSNSFRLKINFEEGLLFKNLSGDTTVVLEKDPTKVFEGSGSAALYLKSPQKSSESISSNYFELPNTPCYLEFDYTCSIPFQIGLQAENNSGGKYGEYIAGFFPKATWGKIYVDLSPFISNTKTSYSRYYIKLRSNLEEFDGKYKSGGSVFIDNFKVIAR